MDECRILVGSNDPAVGQELAAALAAIGATIELQSLASFDPGATPPALCVIHFDLEPSAETRQRLLSSIGSPVIAVVPGATLAVAVELLQSSGHLVGVMVAERMDPRRLSAMATRIIRDDVFGLDKEMLPTTQIHAVTVGDFKEKSACMARIAAFVEDSNVPRTYREPIAQCLDEMLMNALYDAPVDADGTHIFAGIPTRTRITMRTAHTVAVQYAYDGKHLGISVCDAFGTLDRHTVLRYLHKCLHADQSIDRKAGGAGVGLYLMVNSSSVVSYNVLPGIATEALCVFDLEAPTRLEQFGFVLKKDPAGRVASGPARRVLVARRSRTVALAVVAAIAATVLIGAVAWPRWFGKPRMERVTFTTVPDGATIEIDGRTVGVATGTLSVDLEGGRRREVIARADDHDPARAVVIPGEGADHVTLALEPVAKVELDSDPTGASVVVDGTPMGSAPLTLTSFAPRRQVSIVFEQAGYQSATSRLEVPARGATKRVVQPLARSDKFARVRFVSSPPGAQLRNTDQPSTADRTYTPADVFVEVGKVQRFTMTMPKHAPLVIEPFTPRLGESDLVKGGELVTSSPQP